MLSNATMVYTTPTLVSTPKVYIPCQNQVKLILINEAARYTELELIPLLAFYHKADRTVLIGDLKQLLALAVASAE